MFYNFNPKIKCIGLPKQKMFTLEEINWYDNLFGFLTTLQTIYISM